MGGLFVTIGLYYYGRIMKTLFSRKPNEDEAQVPACREMWVAVFVCTAATVVIGVYPQPFIHAMDWVLRVN